ncbi:MAG: glycosyltransferase family 39 protein, partial [Alphaproteobacteria bacterium]|nr:glycosyltransferase family 39 protein [Alphaproteobacteria bacterium]
MQAIAKALGTTRGFVLAAFVAALVPRLTLALIWPQRSGDTKVYLTVARNILENACVSLSDPASGACLPHWGGNQLPGYPAFVALVWKLFGESDIAIVIAQSVIGAAAVAYAGYALLRFLGDARRAVWGVALLAFSPLCVPWTRWILTDGLSIAATLWVFSELVLSIARRQLRILAVALSAITALFLRYDNIVLIVPIALVGVALHGFTQAS